MILFKVQCLHKIHIDETKSSLEFVSCPDMIESYDHLKTGFLITTHLFVCNLSTFYPQYYTLLLLLLLFFFFFLLITNKIQNYCICLLLELAWAVECVRVFNIYHVLTLYWVQYMWRYIIHQVYESSILHKPLIICFIKKLDTSTSMYVIHNFTMSYILPIAPNQAIVLFSFCTFL